MSNEKTQLLEKRIKLGELDAMYQYAHDTLANYQLDKAELKRRQMKLFMAEFDGNSGILGLLVMISAHIPDFKFCDFWIPELENVGEPAAGFYAYQILQSSQREEDLVRGLKYLESSAQNGFLEAKREVYRLSVSDKGFVGKLSTVVFGAKLAIEAMRISMKNSRDPRLPRLPKS